MGLGHHEIRVCTRCRVGGDLPGLALIDRLRVLAAAHSPRLFSIDEIGCMAGCGRPLTVGFSAYGKASYLFGDIDPREHAGPLIEFARLYSRLPDGWTNEGHRPAGLAGKTIARIPAPSKQVAP